MTKKLICLLVLLFCSVPVFAQSVDTAWVRRYNGPPGNYGDFALALAVDDSGNVYVTGGSAGFSETGSDYATIKYYPDGDTAWVRRYNGPGNEDDKVTAMAVDDSGNIYVTGGSDATGFENFDYATIKYYYNGDTAWVRRYNAPANGSDFASSIVADNSGNVYVTGTSETDGVIYDYVTIKYSAEGETLWVRRYPGPELDDYAPSLVIDDNGNVYVTGASYSTESDYDYITIKYNADGDTVWVRRYNGPGNSEDDASAIAVDGSGNVCVTGASVGSGTSFDYATIKYDPQGNQLWVKTYNGPGNSGDGAYAIAVDGSDNVYVTGESGWDYATIKYDPAGNQLWVKTYNGPGNGNDYAYAIALDGSGNVYITGFSMDSVTGYDYATIKYDPATGKQLWVQRYNGSGNSGDGAYAIAVDGSGNVYITGFSMGSATSSDYATIKYIQFLRGDANHDKKVTIADVVYLVSYLFKFGPPPNQIQSGDANCDGQVTIADIVYLVSYLFKHGPAPCQ